MDTPRTIVEILDIMRDDQRRLDKAIADLRTLETGLPKTKTDDDE